MSGNNLGEWAVLSQYAGWFVGLSLTGLAISALLLPNLIIGLPEDYFTGRHRHHPAAEKHPVLHWLLMLVQNIFGFVLVAAGVAMLILPGQGILTLLAGLMIMNYPGKFALERQLVRQPRILRLLNRWRTRHGCKPFLPPLAAPHQQPSNPRNKGK